MRSTQQLSITLPKEMAEIIRAKVATGEYATESEVIRDGLRALLARDRAIEGWLKEQVAPAYDALKADPSRSLSGCEPPCQRNTIRPPPKSDVMIVVFTPEAQAQLAELYRYIADAASPDVAIRFTDGIVTYCESLRTFPHRGTQRDDVRPGLRITNSENELSLPSLWMPHR